MTNLSCDPEILIPWLIPVVNTCLFVSFLSILLSGVPDLEQLDVFFCMQRILFFSQNVMICMDCCGIVDHEEAHSGSAYYAVSLQLCHTYFT